MNMNFNPDIGIQNNCWLFLQQNINLLLNACCLGETHFSMFVNECACCLMINPVSNPVTVQSSQRSFLSTSKYIPLYCWQDQGPIS